MEGRSFSGFYRNTSEELFIKTMMEDTIGMPAPTMEMLGFKNLTQNFRVDSEELFKTWLTNGDSNGCHPTGMGHRPRQASRRISAELSSLTNRTGGVIHNKPNDDVISPSPTSAAVDSSNDLVSTRTRDEKATNLFLAKAWFHSSQPMTRSRSSELRRRYVAMQNSQTSIGIEAMHAASGNGVNNFRQESTDTNGFNNIPICENPYQFNAFESSTNSSSSGFNNTQVRSPDKISSVVSILKGTLERKKLGNQLEESLLEGIIGPMNPTQMSIMSREPSQSESSAAPHVISNCFDMFDDNCVSVQDPSVCESSKNQMGDGKSSEDCYRTQDVRERMYDNSKDDQKRKGGLIRYGSVISVGSADKGDPTKKRRVERSRKMAEAKERSSTPVIPSDMQSILKRCENLEKEVRSLKLNLAFMNRKDSEQTKQIEELEKQNDELSDEKERLLEEIERIIGETGNM